MHWNYICNHSWSYNLISPEKYFNTLLCHILMISYLLSSGINADVTQLMRGYSETPEAELGKVNDPKHIIESGLDYDLDNRVTLPPDEAKKIPNRAVFLGFMTDHLLQDGEPVDPVITYRDATDHQAIPYSPPMQLPTDRNSKQRISLDHAIPQHQGYLVLWLQELFLESPAELSHSNKTIDTLYSLPLTCYAWCNEQWKPLTLPADTIESNKVSTSGIWDYGCPKGTKHILSKAWDLKQLIAKNTCLQKAGTFLLKAYIPLTAEEGSNDIQCIVTLTSILVNTDSHTQSKGLFAGPEPVNILPDDPEVEITQAQSALDPLEKLVPKITGSHNATAKTIPEQAVNPDMKLVIADIDDTTFFTSHIKNKPPLVLIQDKTATPCKQTIQQLKAHIDQHSVLLVYLTATPPVTLDTLKQGLYKNKIPGPVICCRLPSFERRSTSQALRQQFASLGSIAFKLMMMKQLTRYGSVLAAFGDRSTDYHAYIHGGVPPEKIFMMCREGLFQASQLLLMNPAQSHTIKYE